MRTIYGKIIELRVTENCPYVSTLRRSSLFPSLQDRSGLQPVCWLLYWLYTLTPPPLTLWMCTLYSVHTPHYYGVQVANSLTTSIEIATSRVNFINHFRPVTILCCFHLYPVSSSKIRPLIREKGFWGHVISVCTIEINFILTYCDSIRNNSTKLTETLHNAHAPCYPSIFDQNNK